MNKEKIFSTRDLYLASVLVTLKFYMLGMDFVLEGQRNLPIGYFNFADSPSIQEAKTKYVQGLLSVEPKQFITNLKSLKSEIVNRYNNPHIQE